MKARTCKRPDIAPLGDFVYRYRALFGLALVLFILILPQMGVKTSFKRLVINTMIFSCLGLSLNLTTGHTGLVSLGHAAYYSIGAFMTAILSTKLGWNFPACMLASVGVAALAGFIVGLPSLRLTGAYLCIVTLGFAEVIKVIELAWEPVTNGSRGIRSIPSPVFFGHALTVRND
ncbi:MAG: branched-chain amino acid ABC transporter permease, partial [Clostridiales bacterium]|nr:branched-chain amino acid ABC transporter permease [Clostridiales bacterium]